MSLVETKNHSHIFPGKTVWLIRIIPVRIAAFGPFLYGHQLAAKAQTDEAAKAEMKAKQTELAALNSELLQLQQNQQQG